MVQTNTDLRETMPSQSRSNENLWNVSICFCRLRIVAFYIKIHIISNHSLMWISAIFNPKWLSSGEYIGKFLIILGFSNCKLFRTLLVFDKSPAGSGTKYVFKEIAQLKSSKSHVLGFTASIEHEQSALTMEPWIGLESGNCRIEEIAKLFRAKSRKNHRRIAEGFGHDQELSESSNILALWL